MNHEVIFFLAGCMVALVGAIYAALQWEIRKLRKQGHSHATRLVVLSLAISMMARKVGIEYRGWKEEE